MPTAPVVVDRGPSIVVTTNNEICQHCGAAVGTFCKKECSIS